MIAILSLILLSIASHKNKIDVAEFPQVALIKCFKGDACRDYQLEQNTSYHFIKTQCKNNLCNRFFERSSVEVFKNGTSVGEYKLPESDNQMIELLKRVDTPFNEGFTREKLTKVAFINPDERIIKETIPSIYNAEIADFTPKEIVFIGSEKGETKNYEVENVLSLKVDRIYTCIKLKKDAVCPNVTSITINLVSDKPRAVVYRTNGMLYVISKVSKCKDVLAYAYPMGIETYKKAPCLCLIKTNAIIISTKAKLVEELEKKIDNFRIIKIDNFKMQHKVFTDFKSEVIVIKAVDGKMEYYSYKEDKDIEDFDSKLTRLNFKFSESKLQDVGCNFDKVISSEHDSIFFFYNQTEMDSFEFLNDYAKLSKKYKGNKKLQFYITNCNSLKGINITSFPYVAYFTMNDSTSYSEQIPPFNFNETDKLIMENNGSAINNEVTKKHHPLLSSRQKVEKKEKSEEKEEKGEKQEKEEKKEKQEKEEKAEKEEKQEKKEKKEEKQDNKEEEDDEDE